MNFTRGFTLIELISVMVVLGIIGTLSTQFVVTSVDSYHDTQVRHRLVAKGRTSLEQMARYLRAAVPNSVRVSSSGLCVELMPTVAGAFYEGQVPDSDNGAASISSITTSPISLDLGSANQLVIAALDASEIYSVSGARIDIDSTTASGINFSFPHIFVRNSINNRAYIADDPVRFCADSGDLIFREGYGVLANLIDGNPGGTSSVMADDVTPDGTAFELASGTEDRNTSLDINLIFVQENVRVALNQTVLIRNVP